MVVWQKDAAPEDEKSKLIDQLMVSNGGGTRDHRSRRE
jgi:hypothetical protein